MNPDSERPRDPVVADTRAERREPRFVYLSDAGPERSREDAPRRVARFGWRLDAANHRPLGRGVAVVTSLEACVVSVHRLRNGFDAAQLTIATAGSRSQWNWRLALAGDPVAVSAHAFDRRVECQRAYSHFVEALHTAVPDAGVVRSYGPRTLRAFDLDTTEDGTVRR